MADEREAKPLDKRIGRNVRARRLEIGMSQERLAELLGITFQQVQKYEKGVNRTAASRLFDIAKALNCSVLRLYGIDPTSDTGSEMLELLDDAQSILLARDFKKVRGHKRRQMVIDLARELATA